ncbi:GGDEF domain-containing protein [Oricola sp.]|uniref:GGDEF domain-containing protein n=1 Tax=Oricola sp. TaxID=1979950 RepID=UPI0025F8CEBF|nr:GGDEF domain-containing protein [Oricola sp.]MCI5075009.1 GGDEF domain-containing protein [Oricola sp.]
MFEQSYFQLLNPLISLTFAGGFLVLWHYARDIRSLRFFSASYFLAACAMVADFLQAMMAPVVASALLTSLYVVASVFFCAGLYQLYTNRVPWKPLSAAGAVVLVAYTVLRLGIENVVPSAWAINVGIATLYLHSLFVLRRHMRSGMHRALQCVVATSAVLLVVRTAVVFWYVGVTMTEADYAGSLASVTLQLFLAVASLAIAVVLFVMFGTKIVGRMTEKSYTDPLTGALNRRGFEARIATLVGDRTATERRHAVVMADLDQFKSVNDTYGHEAGDVVIMAFAKLLRDSARAEDVVVRWGGEEFLVVVANSETASARLFAEGVRVRWEAIRHDCLDGGSVTASFGVAGWRSGQDVAGVGRAVDAALYQAKREGRNRVCVDRPDPPAKPVRAEVA